MAVTKPMTGRSPLSKREISSQRHAGTPGHIEHTSLVLDRDKRNTIGSREERRQRQQAYLRELDLQVKEKREREGAAAKRMRHVEYQDEPMAVRRCLLQAVVMLELHRLFPSHTLWIGTARSQIASRFQGGLEAVISKLSWLFLTWTARRVSNDNNALLVLWQGFASVLQHLLTCWLRRRTCKLHPILLRLAGTALTSKCIIRTSLKLEMVTTL